MFDKALIPAQNAQLKQNLQNLYAQIAISGDIRSLVDEKFEKVLTSNKKKITQAVTISAYFDELWKQSDLKAKHKDYAIKKLEAIQKTKKEQILKGDQIVGKTPANLEVVNGIFQMNKFEQFNFTEKLKNIKNRRQLDIESDLFGPHPVDLDVLYAVNRAPTSAKSYNNLKNVHYTSGLIDVDETEKVKVHKAEEFVKKIKDEKKEFSKKIKKIEKNMDARELEDLERYQKQKQEEEEQRLKDKKQRLENHIKELKARSEARLKESTKFEEEYFNNIGKKPMFKEMEKSFKRGYAIPELEERKRKLQEIRALHKPITKEEIQEHELKVKKLAEDRSLERKEHAQTSKWNYEKPSFESKHHKTFAEELSKVRHQKENNITDLKQKKEKIMELMQEVKEKHYPRADPQKELELAGIIEDLKKKREGRFLETREEADQEQIDVRKIGGEYLKQAKEYIQKHKKETPKDGAVSPTKGNETPRKGHNSSMLLSPLNGSPTVKKHDYLADLRKENKIQSSANQVDLIIKNKSGLEKKELLESEVEKLEEKAKKKEQVNKYYKNKKDDATRATDNEEVDQIYLNAIKAKLELLSS